MREDGRRRVRDVRLAENGGGGWGDRRRARRENESDGGGDSRGARRRRLRLIVRTSPGTVASDEPRDHACVDAARGAREFTVCVPAQRRAFKRGAGDDGSYPETRRFVSEAVRSRLASRDDAWAAASAAVAAAWRVSIDDDGESPPGESDGFIFRRRSVVARRVTTRSSRQSRARSWTRSRGSRASPALTPGRPSRSVEPSARRGRDRRRFRRVLHGAARCEQSSSPSSTPRRNGRVPASGAWASPCCSEPARVCWRRSRGTQRRGTGTLGWRRMQRLLGLASMDRCDDAGERRTRRRVERALRGT